MSMIRWEPFPETVSLRQAMDRLFQDSFVIPSRFLPEVSGPAVNVYETNKAVVVTANVPGLKAEDMDIHVAGDVLVIKGETRSEKETKQKGYVVKERSYGSFSRSITLPASVKVDKADAALEDGVLTLTLPKSEALKPRTIKVEAKSPARQVKVRSDVNSGHQTFHGASCPA